MNTHMLDDKIKNFNGRIYKVEVELPETITDTVEIKPSVTKISKFDAYMFIDKSQKKTIYATHPYSDTVNFEDVTDDVKSIVVNKEINPLEWKTLKERIEESTREERKKIIAQSQKIQEQREKIEGRFVAKVKKLFGDSEIIMSNLELIRNADIDFDKAYKYFQDNNISINDYQFPVFFLHKRSLAQFLREPENCKDVIKSSKSLIELKDLANSKGFDVKMPKRVISGFGKTPELFDETINDLSIALNNDSFINFLNSKNVKSIDFIKMGLVHNPLNLLKEYQLKQEGLVVSDIEYHKDLKIDEEICSGYGITVIHKNQKAIVAFSNNDLLSYLEDQFRLNELGWHSTNDIEHFYSAVDERNDSMLSKALSKKMDKVDVVFYSLSDFLSTHNDDFKSDKIMEELLEEGAVDLSSLKSEVLNVLSDLYLKNKVDHTKNKNFERKP